MAAIGGGEIFGPSDVDKWINYKLDKIESELGDGL